MITAIGRDEGGQPLIYLGLTPENIQRMVAGEPLSIPATRLREIGFPNPVRIVVAHVESYAAGVAMLREHSPDLRGFQGAAMKPVDLAAVAPPAPPPGVTLMDAGNCPVCKTHLGAHYDPAGAQRPKPGDASICAHCTSFLILGEGMVLREMSIEEVAALDDNTRNELTRARRMFQSRRPR